MGADPAATVDTCTVCGAPHFNGDGTDGTVSMNVVPDHQPVFEPADPAATDVEQARGLYDSMVQHTHVEHMRKLDDESVDTSECDQLVERYWGELRAAIEQRVHEQYASLIKQADAVMDAIWAALPDGDEHEGMAPITGSIVRAMDIYNLSRARTGLAGGEATDGE